MANKQKDKYGLTSLILGILSVLFMFFGFGESFFSFFGFILIILTFIFSSIQLRDNKNNLATTGLILGFIALSIFLLDAVSSVPENNQFSSCEISQDTINFVEGLYKISDDNDGILLAHCLDRYPNCLSNVCIEKIKEVIGK